MIPISLTVARLFTSSGMANGPFGGSLVEVCGHRQKDVRLDGVRGANCLLL